MDYCNNKLKEINKLLTEFLAKIDIVSPNITFDKTNDNVPGDITTNVAMQYAKKLQKPPMQLAQEISSFLSSLQHPLIKSVEASKPGFINIFLSSSFYNEVINDVLKGKSSFGKSNMHQGKKWVIEHTSPNPNKAMHIGHLRINLVGMSLSNIIEWEGAEVIRDAVNNNRGISIAKLMYGFILIMRKKDGLPADYHYWFDNKNEWYSPEELEILPDVFVTQCYIAGESASKEDPATDKKIRDIVILWEKNDPIIRALWSHVLEYSYAGINRTLKRLGNKWDHVWNEHEYYQEGKDYVEKGVQKGIFQQLPDGAVLTNLSSYNIPDTIVLKSDKTSLYITQDIALTAKKKQKYGADYMVWVVGPEQSTALKQVFAVCEQLEIGKRDEFIHVTYGYVGLADKDGGFQKMSSRKGNVILIDDVIDRTKDFIKMQMHQKAIVDSDIDNRAETLALAAVKFSILKSNKDQQIAFDIERSIDTKGDTGIYVLYTYARMKAILRKAQEQNVVSNISDFPAKNIFSSDFPWFNTYIQRASSDFSSHHIAQYVLELCGKFNSWYSNEQILDGSDQQAHKLAIVEAGCIIMKNALNILGIDTVDKV